MKEKKLISAPFFEVGWSNRLENSWDPCMSFESFFKCLEGIGFRLKAKKK